MTISLCDAGCYPLLTAGFTYLVKLVLEKMTDEGMGALHLRFSIKPLSGRLIIRNKQYSAHSTNNGHRLMES